MAKISTNQTSVAAQFEQFLLDHGFLNQALSEKYQTAKGTNQPVSVLDVIKILEDAKVMGEEELTQAKAAFLNLPYIDLSKQSIKNEVLNLVPEESRSFYNAVPFSKEGKILKVAVSDPSNLQVLEALEFLGQKQNFDIQIFVASPTNIAAALGVKQSLTNVVGEALKDIQQTENFVKTSAPREKEGPQVIEDAPISKIVDVILTNAVESNASDIHIEPSETDVRVRFRIDGILHSFLQLPKNVHSAIISRIKILSNLKIDEQRLPQDGRFHIDVGRKSIDLRVSTLPLMYGEKVVMRLLDKGTSVPTLDQLGLRGKALSWVMESIKKPHGIFLITGPTGSGKSTSLYSILSLRNNPTVNIVTLEDPVEYFMEGVNQSQVNPEIGLTFAAGLRSILRQDPNIIMVGEIRDQETAELAVHAALTGHLVFSTLHTNNAVGAVPRLINMGIEPFLLSASMNLVVAQRLVRKLCQECKIPIKITALAQKEITQELVGIPQDYLEGIDVKNYKVYGAKGCDKCGGSGYKGRIGIFEVLPILPELQEMIFSQTQSRDIYEATAKIGMISMKQDGIVKVLRAETTLEELIRVTTE